MDLAVDGKITLEAPLTMAETVKQIPGARHDSKRGLWMLPRTWATCVIARGVFGDRLEVGDELAAWAGREYEARIAPALKAREETE